MESREKAVGNGDSSHVTPVFKAVMDDYEAFYDDYIAFIDSFTSGSDMLPLMDDCLAMMEKMEKWSDPTAVMYEAVRCKQCTRAYKPVPADDAYFHLVTMRINRKLTESVKTKV